MKHPGYLTRRDHIILATAVLVLIPAVTVGFAHLALTAFVLVVGAIVLALGRGIWQVLRGRRVEAPVVARRVRLTSLLGYRPRIRHDRTIIVEERPDPEE